MPPGRSNGGEIGTRSATAARAYSCATSGSTEPTDLQSPFELWPHGPEHGAEHGAELPRRASGICGGGRPGPESVRRQAAPEAAPGSELRHRQDGALTMLPHWYCHGVLLQVSRGLVLTCG